MRAPVRRTLALAGAHACAALLALPAVAGAVTLPPGFAERTAYSGLTLPTAMEFAPDGRVFVAEKSGLVKVFSGPGDASADVVADLRTQVYNASDRGLLDIALDPEFDSEPYLYVLYTRDAEIGGTAPLWGTPDTNSDPCPDPPGRTTDGCVVSGRLSRMRLDGGTAGAEQVLIDDWCQQYPSHSVGAIAFDDTGALLASGGDGASYTFTDWGQRGIPLNPCGDPPAGVEGAQTPPEAEGGALRSQDLRTLDDPTGLNGTVIRVDRTDGSPLPDNPNAGLDDPNARRIVADGLRNPFRIAVRPGTSELWIGDVGWDKWEELNRANLADHANFGWPCSEGDGPQPGYDTADLDICEDLYAQPGSMANPFYAYDHGATVVPDESCPHGGSATSGIAFYEGGPFPEAYEGALFFADYARDCIWAMRAGADGIPDPDQIETFAAAASNPVNLVIGDDGALYYPDIGGGAIKVIRHFSGNQPPSAAATADPQSGSGPLTVNFDGSGSADPDAGDTLGYEWDLDGDGEFDDSSEVAPARTYETSGTHSIGLRVTDPWGASDQAQLSIQVDNTPPEASVDLPDAALEWSVGETISFSGSADDPEQGALGPEALDWELIQHHCPSNCHEHPLEEFEGVDAGSFSAPDHEYPSHLELRLTATDEGGLSDTTSVELHPRTIEITMLSKPPGAEVAIGATAGPAPLGQEVIVGSDNSIGAEATFVANGRPYAWDAWEHGGPRQQNVTAPDANVTFVATYRDPATEGPPLGPSPPFDDPSLAPWPPPADPPAGDEGCPGGTSRSVTCARETGGGVVMRGTKGDEILIGTPGEDRILGRGGEDRLVGKKGADELRGGPGEDVLNARDHRGDPIANCGGGHDHAEVDRAKDRRVESCEDVRRG